MGNSAVASYAGCADTSADESAAGQQPVQTQEGPSRVEAHDALQDYKNDVSRRSWEWTTRAETDFEENWISRKVRPRIFQPRNFFGHVISKGNILGIFLDI